MDLMSMNMDQLRKLNEQVAEQLVRRQRTERSEAIEKIYSIANSIGIPLKTLFANNSGRKSSRPAASYRDPDNPDNTWMGRGPRPAWLKKELSSGKTLEQFRA